jgi:hypothetical protein
MRWVQEPNHALGQWATSQVLITEADELLDGALVDFWRKILSYLYERGFQMECAFVSFQVHPREYEDQPPYGSITCEFKDKAHKAVSKDQFVVRSHELTILRPDACSDEEWERMVLRWTLDQCSRLRAAGHTNAIQALFTQILTTKPFECLAAGMYGWFNLGMYQEAPGPLAADDQKLLTGAVAVKPKANSQDPVLSGFMQKVSAALADLIPPEYRSISSAIRIKQSGQQFGIGYQIEVPADQPQKLLEPSPTLHEATRQLILYWLQNNGNFPGLQFRVDLQSDNTIKTQANVIK